MEFRNPRMLEAIRRAYGAQALEFITDEIANDLHEAYIPLMSHEEINDMDGFAITDDEYEEEYKEYWARIRRLRPVLVRLASGNKSKMIGNSFILTSAFVSTLTGFVDIPQGSDEEKLIRFLVSDLDPDNLFDHEDLIDRILIASFRFRVEY